MLASQEILTSLRRYVGAWTNSALRIYIRHDTETGEHPLRSKMTHVNQVSINAAGNRQVLPVSYMNCVELWFALQ